MNALTFDTLKLARKLEAAGFSPEQAAGASAALAETLGDVPGVAGKETSCASKPRSRRPRLKLLNGCSAPSDFRPSLFSER